MSMSCNNMFANTKTMIDSIKGKWALFAAMLMLMAANGLLVTLLSVRGAAAGMSSSSIGLMQAGYPLGALVGCVYAPKLIARHCQIKTCLRREGRFRSFAG